MKRFYLKYRDLKPLFKLGNCSLIKKHTEKGESIQLIAKFKSGLGNRVQEFNKKMGVIELEDIEGLAKQYILHFKNGDFKSIKSKCKAYIDSGLVEFCEPHVRQKVYRNSPPHYNDELFGNQWFYQNTGQFGGTAGEDISLTAAFQHLKERDIVMDDSIRLAILDDGVDPEHEDLDPSRSPMNFDLIDNDNQPDPTWEKSHGTQLAGVIYAISNNGVGIAGINDYARIINGRIYGRHFVSVTAARGIVKAVENGARVINLSWGIENTSPQILDAIQQAIQANVLVICASGNYGSATGREVLFPGNLDQVLTVGACDHKGRWMNLRNCPLPDDEKFGSRYGPSLDVVAPGIFIPTVQLDYDYLPDEPSYTLDFRGTSAATAIVSAIAGLLFSIDPALTALDVREILLRTADDISVNHSAGAGIGFDHIGHGRINALHAIQEIV